MTLGCFNIFLKLHCQLVLMFEILVKPAQNGEKNFLDLDEAHRQPPLSLTS
jgi:hypothetical protein